MTVCAVGAIFTCSGIEYTLFLIWFILLLFFGLLFIAKRISFTPLKIFLIAGILIIPISLAIEYFQSEQPPSSFVMGFRDAVQKECNALCMNSKSGRDNLSGIEYCKQAFKFDFNQDKDLKDSFWANALFFACEDSFYCPHMYHCVQNNYSDVLSFPKCTELMCSTFLEKHIALGSDNPKTDAENEIKSLIKRGSCQLPEGEADWYKIYYETTPLCP